MARSGPDDHRTDDRDAVVDPSIPARSPGDPDDAALAQAARAGDTEAYEELVLRYQQVAFRTAFLIVRSAPDAEDVTQEAFVKAYRAMDRFRPGAPFRPWILSIVANEARNRRRSVARRRERPPFPAWSGDAGAAPSEPADPQATPEQEAERHEQRDVLLAAMRDLSEEDRLVLAYRWFLDLSESEMAEAMGVARGTVKSRLSRAMARLRTRLTGGPVDG
jgi:RNA polymerase sigma factor (sigma-70 family)